MSPTPLSYADVNRLVLGALTRPSRRYWLTLAILGSGLAVGIGCYLHQLRLGLGVAGINHPIGWGIYITCFVYWVGIAHSGTLISAILHLFRARWRQPIYRSAEAMTVFAVMIAGLFPLLDLGRIGVFHFTLPYPNQRHLWPNFNSPIAWDVLAIATYFLVSSIFLFVGMLPDLAAVRDAAPPGFRRRLFSALALGWRGASGQFHHYGRSYLYFAALATVIVFSVSGVVSFEFAVTLLPGWHSTLFAPYFVAGAIHSGLAMVLILAITIRRWLGLEPLITLDHLENIAKVMLFSTAVVGYVYIVEPFIAWISGDRFEWTMTAFRAAGPFAPLFWLMIVLNVGLPLSLAWKRARRNLPWLFVLSLLVNIGMWLERFIIIVASTAHDFLPANWGSYHPTWIEIGILQGSLCLFGLLVLLFVRHLPPVSIAETKTELAPAERSGRAPAGKPVAAESVGESGRPGGLLAVFSSDRHAAGAAAGLAQAGMGEIEVFAPFASPAIQKLVRRSASPVQWWGLAGGMCGLALGLALPIWSDSIFRINVGSKPHPSIPSFLVVALLAAVLLASIANGVGLVIHALWRGSRAPRAAYDPRFTVDRFGVWVRCGAPQLDQARRLLAGAGAEEIHAHAG